MIIRIWRGWANKDQPDDYPLHFLNHVLPELRQVEGFREADLLRDDVEEFIEFTVVTRWESIEAISAFAGDDLERAVVESGAVAALHHYDDRVRHHRSITHGTSADDSVNAP